MSPDTSYWVTNDPAMSDLLVTCAKLIHFGRFLAHFEAHRSENQNLYLSCHRPPWRCSRYGLLVPIAMNDVFLGVHFYVWIRLGSGSDLPTPLLGSKKVRSRNGQIMSTYVNKVILPDLFPFLAPFRGSAPHGYQFKSNVKLGEHCTYNYSRVARQSLIIFFELITAQWEPVDPHPLWKTCFLDLPWNGDDVLWSFFDFEISNPWRGSKMQAAIRVHNPNESWPSVRENFSSVQVLCVFTLNPGSI